MEANTITALLGAGSDRNCTVPSKPQLSLCPLLSGLFQAGIRGTLTASRWRWVVPVGSASPGCLGGAVETLQKVARQLQVASPAVEGASLEDGSDHDRLRVPWWRLLSVSEAEVLLLQAPCKRTLRDSQPCCLRAKTEGGESRHRRGKLFAMSCSIYLIHIRTVLNPCSQRCIRARDCTDV